MPSSVKAGVPTSELLWDEQVLPAVIELIEEAEEYVVLVSPYNDFSVHLSDVVKRKARQVNVVAVCRSDRAKEEKAHLNWLASLSVRVHLAERLHSKIYLNESQAIVTSMNLTKGSAVNSKEVAFRIYDTETREKISHYVRNRLIDVSKPYRASTTPPRSSRSSTGSKAAKRSGRGSPQVSGGLLSSIAEFAAVFVSDPPGSCVRCGNSIYYNQDRPLCDGCYEEWSRYSKSDYQERYCHRCGRPSKTSYARPLCRSCWKKAQS